MIRKIVIVAAFASLLGGPSVLAADIDMAPIEPAEFDWSGIYIGGHIGWAWADIEYFANLTGEDVDVDPDGLVGGGQIGYNFDFGSFVIGPEASFTFADVDDDDFDSAVNPVVTYGGNIDWYAIFGGRIGLAMDRVLVYVNGGYAIAEVGTEGNNPGIPDAFEDDETHHGFAIGGGIDWAFTDNLIAGINFTHVNLSDEDHDGTTDIGLAYTNFDVDAEINALTFRLGWLF